MSVDKLDLTDPDILRMVLANHEPQEEWLLGGGLSVFCRTCHRAWPCESITAARAVAADSADRIATNHALGAMRIAEAMRTATENPGRVVTAEETR